MLLTWPFPCISLKRTHHGLKQNKNLLLLFYFLYQTLFLLFATRYDYVPRAVSCQCLIGQIITEFANADLTRLLMGSGMPRDLPVG
jgi:hypothetical protein